MHENFSGGGHFEGPEERPQFCSPHTFSPFVPENRAAFFEIQNNSFRGSFALPELSINIGGEPPFMPPEPPFMPQQPPFMPGFEQHIPGPPVFYTQPPQWGGGYQFGYNEQPYAPTGYAPGPFEGAYNNGYYPQENNQAYNNGYNPQENNPVYTNAYDAGYEAGLHASQNNGANYEGNPNTVPGEAPPAPYTQYNPGSQPAGSDNGIVQTSYDASGNPVQVAGDAPTATPATVPADTAQPAAQDAPPPPAQAAQDAPASPSPTQAADQTAPGADAVQAQPPAAADSCTDQQQMIDKLVNTVPLGTADIAGYIPTPSDINVNTVPANVTFNAVPTDQTGSVTNNPAAVPTDSSTVTNAPTSDQTGTQAAPPADQPTSPVAPPSDQSGSPAAPPSDQPGTPAASPPDQGGTPASAPGDQPGAAAPAPADQTHSQQTTSDNTVPSIYQTSTGS